MEKARPGVVTWYRVYCGLMALLYFALAAAGIIGLFFMEELTSGSNAMSPLVALLMLLMWIALGLVFGAVFVAPFFLSRRPWAWIYHLVLIAIGMTSPCCMPASIPLLIFWLKQETREYFGRVH
ncbi:MAG: hypothetical protein JXO72_04830 [Vicinamibacteria bacterium]|nr:hypothetical protein [Vicinamibacteria bacterium]